MPGPNEALTRDNEHSDDILKGTRIYSSTIDNRAGKGRGPARGEWHLAIFDNFKSISGKQPLLRHMKPTNILST